jgi:hypothetical protein
MQAGWTAGVGARERRGGCYHGLRRALSASVEWLKAGALSARFIEETGAWSYLDKNASWLKGGSVFFVRCVWKVESKMNVQNLICTPVSHMHQIYSLKKRALTTATVSHATLDRVLTVPLYLVMHELRRQVFSQKWLQLLAQE